MKKSRGDIRVSRRDFITQTSTSLAAGAILGGLSGCNEKPIKVHPASNDVPLPFPGKVMTAQPTICHRHRDGKLRIPTGKASSHIHDVIILGGGASGLAAARRLQQDGIDNFVIVDKDSTYGGQARYGEWDGIKYPIAGHYCESPHPISGYLMRLFLELNILTGIDDEGWPIPNNDYVLQKPFIKTYANGKWATDEFPEQIASSSDSKEYIRFNKKMYDYSSWRDDKGMPAFNIPSALTSDHPKIRELDQITMREYLWKTGFRSKLLHWFVDNRLINEYGTDASQTSAWSGIQFWAASTSGFDEVHEGPPSKQVMLTWEQGTGFITDGLAKKLVPKQLMTEHLAIHIRNREHHVDVTCLDMKTHQTTTLKGRYVIYACPKNMLHRVMPELETAKRYEFQQLSYVPWITAAVALRQTPRLNGQMPAWDNIPYDRGWALGYVSASHVMRKPKNYRGPTVATFYGALYQNMVAERQELLEGDFDHWGRLIQGELERLHPQISADIEQMHIYKWAHSMTVPEIGAVWGDRRMRMQQPEGNVYFAHSDISGAGLIEEAVYNGIQAAQNILKKMSKSSFDDLAPGDFSKS